MVGNPCRRPTQSPLRWPEPTGLSGAELSACATAFSRELFARGAKMEDIETIDDACG